MSTGKTKNTGSPKNVPEAVKHLRRQLKLSMEKFGARVGCSFQTVVRWEAGRAHINYLNLLKLMALAQEHDRVAEPIFANEIRSYRIGSAVDGLDETGLKQALARASIAKLHDLRATLDQVQELLDKGDVKKAGIRLRRVRTDLQSWINESAVEQSRRQK
jgi:DNA-binding transcriptional regulator YiaG